MNILLWPKKNHEDFNNSAKCWICKKRYEEGEMKVKNHDQVTGKYRQSENQERNLNLSLGKKMPRVFHNVQDYDWLLLFQEIGKYNFKIYLKPNTREK